MIVALLAFGSAARIRWQSLDSDSGKPPFKAAACGLELPYMQHAMDDFVVHANWSSNTRLTAPHCVDRWAIADGLNPNADTDIVLLAHTAVGWKVLTAGTDLGEQPDFGIPEQTWAQLFH